MDQAGMVAAHGKYLGDDVFLANVLLGSVFDGDASNPIEPKPRSVMNVWSPNPNCRRNDDRRGLPPPTRMSAASILICI